MDMSGRYGLIFYPSEWRSIELLNGGNTNTLGFKHHKYEGVHGAHALSLSLSLSRIETTRKTTFFKVGNPATLHKTNSLPLKIGLPKRDRLPTINF